MLNWVKSGLWLGHSRTVTELLWSHSFVILAVCLESLSCWKVNLRPSLRSWALWRRFSSRIYLYLAAFIFPSIATSRPVPAAEKHPHSMMLPPPCFTVGTVLDRWWAVPGFLHTYRLELRPKSYILVSSDQRIGGLQWWFDFLQLSPILLNASLELSHSDLWVLLYLSHQGSSPPIAQFGRTASSRKGSGRPKRLPFKDYGGPCALGNLKCSIIFLYPWPDLCLATILSLSSSGSSFDLMILICSDMHCEL